MIRRILAKAVKRNERGISLIEVMVSLALLGIIGVAFLSSTATTSTSRAQADHRASAKIIAEGILDNVKKVDYDSSGNYTCTVPVDYPGYSANLTVGDIGYNIQKITVLVAHGGDDILTLENYKVMR